jgi:mannose-6-phosphate isomerase-like protein (cupin superfamily)
LASLLGRHSDPESHHARVSAAKVGLLDPRGRGPSCAITHVHAPGFDVGAHLHRNAEELFYVLEGQLDLLAFEPRVRTPGNWQSWESHTGATVARGGPGSMMYVPRGCPHAFANPGPGPARMIFLVSPSGHEHYQKQLAELVASPAGPLDAAIAELRARHDIDQLTPVIPGRP